MVKVKHILFWLSPLLFLFGCFNAENLPNTPRIGFQSLEFKNVPNGADSLILSFSFQDGDGDIGLGGNELDPPYHPFFRIEDGDGKVVTLRRIDVKPPFYMRSPNGEIGFFSDFDTRRPYNCVDYEIRPITQNGPVDTVFVKRNENNKNIFVDFYRKRSGVYEFIDWLNVTSTNSCGTNFDARFPVFDPKSIGRGLQGTIKYSMQSSGFNFVLRSDTFQLRFKIKDRALNESNTVVTPDFTLNDILVN